MFGPPGAGKGTQSQLLNSRFNIDHISSGDVFRYNLRQGTPLGLQVKEFMARGVLVPDEVTIDIILNRVMSIASDDGFILDGFPRNPNQAQVLDEALSARSRGLDKVVHIEVSEPELVSRLGGRYVCRNCQAPESVGPDENPEGRTCQQCGGELYQREDDRPEAVQKRIEVYRTETTQVLGFYREKGILVDVPGDGTIDEVNRLVVAALTE